MTNKYAVFIDIDGTLTGENGVNPKNAEAINRARALGHHIFINTGRARSFVNDELLGNISFDGIISGVGSRIDIGETVIFEKLIDSNFVYSCVKHFFHTEKVFSVSGPENTYVINPSPYFLRWKFPLIENPEDFNGKYKNEKVQKLEMFGKNISEDDKAFFAKGTDVYDHGSYIECAPKGCSKSNAIKTVLDYLGIEKENSIAMGDSINDMDMLKNVGTAVAVGNAIDKVKEIADFISVPCEDGGVAYAIEKLLLK